MKLSNKQTIPLLVLILVTLSILLYHNTISLFPAFIHAWTQSERYALALGFLNNGFDFFHPCTFNLQTLNGITRVDFPINEYIVALLMKLFGTTSPAVFRIYTVVISNVGLVYLYLLAKRITGSDLKSFVAVVFVFLSPVYVYYQAGFIPSVPAIAFVFAGCYYYFSYLESSTKKQFAVAVFFLLLASLVRIPFLIFLIAVVVHQAWNYLKRKKVNGFETVVFAASFLLFGMYYRYNVHLGRMYGSMFLDSFLPAKNFDDFKAVLSQIYEVWLLQYFTKAHYLLLLLCVLYSIYAGLTANENLRVAKKYWFHLFIITCGTGLYFLMMLKQYYDHDYYFLDSLFVPVVLFFILVLASVPLQSKVQKAFLSILFALCATVMFIDSDKNQTERTTTYEWDRVEMSRQNFTGMDKFLDSAGISKDAKILVIDAYSTNIPLILMNRKGYTVYQTSRDDAFMPLIKYPWDFVAIQDALLVSDVIRYCPVVTSMLDKVTGNGKVSVYRRKKMQTTSLKEFLKIDLANTIYAHQLNFDSAVTDKHFTACDVTSSAQFHSSPYSGILNTQAEYGATLNFVGKELSDLQNAKVLVSGYVFNESPVRDVQLVASVSDAAVTSYYNSYDIKLQIKKTKCWQKFEMQFVLPSSIKSSAHLGIYLWNKNKETVYYDDLEFIVYK